MFEASVYANRRKVLLERMAAMTKEGERGIAIFLGNVDAAMNYRGNDYKFRQDSNFMYYWGIDEPCFAAVLDLDSADECLYGTMSILMISYGWDLSLLSLPKESRSAVLQPSHWLNLTRQLLRQYRRVVRFTSCLLQDITIR